MSFDYHDRSFRHKILKIGDLAIFKKLENTYDIDRETSDYVGIVINLGDACSDGEITYKVLCEDSIVRIFFDYEADEFLSSIS
jgi:hypothetical protein